MRRIPCSYIDARQFLPFVNHEAHTNNDEPTNSAAVLMLLVECCVCVFFLFLYGRIYIFRVFKCHPLRIFHWLLLPAYLLACFLTCVI